MSEIIIKPCYTLTHDGKETILKVFLLRAIGINSIDAWKDVDSIAKRYDLALPTRYQKPSNNSHAQSPAT